MTTRTRPARHLAYVEQALARTADSRRRADLAAKIAELRAELVGCCRRCGRRLTDPDSLEAGLGRDCARRDRASQARDPMEGPAAHGPHGTTRRGPQ